MQSPDKRPAASFLPESIEKEITKLKTLFLHFSNICWAKIDGLLMTAYVRISRPHKTIYLTQDSIFEDQELTKELTQLDPNTNQFYETNTNLKLFKKSLISDDRVSVCMMPSAFLQQSIKIEAHAFKVSPKPTALMHSMPISQNSFWITRYTQKLQNENDITRVDFFYVHKKLTNALNCWAEQENIKLSHAHVLDGGITQILMTNIGQARRLKVAKFHSARLIILLMFTFICVQLSIIYLQHEAAQYDAIIQEAITSSKTDTSPLSREQYRDLIKIEQSVGFLEVLEQLSRTLPASIWVEEITFEKPQLFFKGSHQLATDILGLKTLIKQSGIFDPITLQIEADETSFLARGRLANP